MIDDDIRTVYADLPLRIHAFTVRNDDYYTIVLNEKLSHAMLMNSYRHEVRHIVTGDFDSESSADMIEIIRHMKGA